MHAIGEGDENAFALLFHTYKQSIYNIAWTYTESTVLSEEIVQDVFVLVWKNREKLSAVNNLPAYLHVMARNRSLRVLQEVARSQHVPLTLPESQLVWPGDLSETEMQRLLNEALELLSPQQRKVFEMSRLNGMSREQVAGTLKISKATVSVHLTLALRLVKGFLLSRIGIFLLLILNFFSIH